MPQRDWRDWLNMFVVVFALDMLGESLRTPFWMVLAGSMVVCLVYAFSVPEEENLSRRPPR